MKATSLLSVPGRLCAAIAISFALTGPTIVARAQAPVPPPAPPPQTQPSVPVLPGKPSNLVSVPLTVATPLATTVPIPTPAPTPSVRTFNCSCFTAASGTEWAGTVEASSYVAARSAATGACVAYITRVPQSPFIQPGQSPGLETGPTGAEPPGAAQSTTTSQPPGTTGSSASSGASALKSEPSITGQTFCNLCACN
jgi:hypothetical protein